MKILVTGAGGFIGSHFCAMVLKTTGHHVRAFARETSPYSARRVNALLHCSDAFSEGRLKIHFGDFGLPIGGICEGIDVVVHFAAKTFVDAAIRDPHEFFMVNAQGSQILLEDAKRHGVKKFLQISTDEVLGAVLDGYADEERRYNPTNPYSASKAAAECMAIAYAHTYGLHTVIPRFENVYGPYQHPQKVIPTFVKALNRGQNLPVYGDGKHVRQWLWVNDASRALMVLIEREDIPPASIWHVAGQRELPNLELAQRIMDAYGPSKSEIQFIPDEIIRPGHDRRYALSTEKLQALGWKAEVDLETGLKIAVEWYKDHQNWM